MDLARRLAAVVMISTLAAACAGEDPGAAADGGGDAAADVAQPDAAEADGARPEDSPRPDGPTASDVPDATALDAPSPEDAAPDAPALDAGDAAADAPADARPDVAPDADVPETVEVSHAREFRGAWVATVWNINFPSRAGLSATAQRAELTATLDAMQRNRLNAVMFQVRPEGDALYRSTLEPWSRYLTGRQGGDPGYDPLAFVVDEAHRRNIEVHAWFNPYRAKSSASSTAVAPHISVTDPSAVVPYDGMLWMNPAAAAVQDRLAAVIRDVASRYDIDGVHFDDYFYPYPESGMPFPDAMDYMRYRSGGGAMSLGDWRRDNVNRMVRRVSETVAAARADVRFGVSPFGIYRPGMPPGITGLDAYNAIYCDPVLWMRQGWVDYLAPQLYWPSTQTAQAFGTLVAWWAGTTSGGRSIFAGTNVGRLGSTPAWTVEELLRQVRLTRAEAPRGARGTIWYTVQPFRSNAMGVADAIRNEFYQRPALTPPMAGSRPPPVAPTVTASGRTLAIAHPAPRSLRAWALYRFVEGAWALERVVPASRTSLDTGASGRFAVSAVTRFGDESRGAVAAVR